MGIDTPLAVLSNQHQPLFNYFKQLFAQVTNPPIDSIREKVVTSTIYTWGGGNVLEEKEENCRMLRINNPILTNTDLLKIKNMDVEGFKVETIPITYYKNTSLEKSHGSSLCRDRSCTEGVLISSSCLTAAWMRTMCHPILLAVSALQQIWYRPKRGQAFL